MCIRLSRLRMTARTIRCMNEIVKNIETFMMGGKRNRVDIDI